MKAQGDLDPTNTTFVHCSALDENNTDPPIPSDMRYQRWYPTTVLLPDGRILILSGTDQDTSVGPRNASATKVRAITPEVNEAKMLQRAAKFFHLLCSSAIGL